MKVSKGWGNGLIVTAPYAGLGLHNYGKLYYFDGIYRVSKKCPFTFFGTLGTLYIA